MTWLDQLLGIGGSTTSSGGGLLSNIGGFFTSIENLGAALINPHTYVRIFMIIFGLFLMFGALKYA